MCFFRKHAALLNFSRKNLCMWFDPTVCFWKNVTHPNHNPGLSKMHQCAQNCMFNNMCPHKFDVASPKRNSAHPQTNRWTMSVAKMCVCFSKKMCFRVPHFRVPQHIRQPGPSKACCCHFSTPFGSKDTYNVPQIINKASHPRLLLRSNSASIFHCQGWESCWDLSPSHGHGDRRGVVVVTIWWDILEMNQMSACYDREWSFNRVVVGGVEHWSTLEPKWPEHVRT